MSDEQGIRMNMQGKFQWNELVARDVGKAKTFYARTLGWSYRDVASPVGVYTLALVDDEPVAGIVPLPDSAPANAPSHWLSYVVVSDVDRRLATIEQAGGRIVKPAFDVPGVARFAIACDAEDAPVGLMTPFEG